MANEEQLALLKQDVNAWNAWRQDWNNIQRIDLTEAILPRAILSRADLRYADLTEADLTEADLTKANLTKANLTKADLTGADLTEADLTGAHLDGAHLHAAYLNGANLNWAHLVGANLTGAELNGAHLNWAHFHRALLNWAYFTGAELNGAYLNGVDLRGAYFTGAELNGAYLNGANLRGVDLNGAHLNRAYLNGADLTGTHLKGAHLTGARLSGAQLVETNLRNATLTDCQVYGVSVWGPKLEGATQNNLVITPPGELVITVDDLEIAQFIYLLLNYNKFRNVIDALTQRGVLILGRFGGGGLEVLHSVAAKLREEKYLPIIFEFGLPTNRNYTETAITLVGLSRFVIVDLSGSSVPQELQATVPNFHIPFVPILENGRRPNSMFSDFLENDWVVRPPVPFRDIEDLIKKIPGRIIAPAEKKLKKRQALRAQIERYLRRN